MRLGVHECAQQVVEAGVKVLRERGHRFVAVEREVGVGGGRYTEGDAPRYYVLRVQGLQIS